MSIESITYYDDKCKKIKGVRPSSKLGKRFWKSYVFSNGVVQNHWIEDSKEIFTDMYWVYDQKKRVVSQHRKRFWVDRLYDMNDNLVYERFRDYPNSKVYWKEWTKEGVELNKDKYEDDFPRYCLYILQEEEI